MSHWTEQTYGEADQVIGEGLRRCADEAGEQISDLLGLLAEYDINPDRALDASCGIGRHSVELALAGIPVNGFDISTSYIEDARERAAEAGVADDTSFEVADIRDLDDIAGVYDLVLHWFAFGYFEDEVNEAIAANLHARTAADGALVMGLDNAIAHFADFEEELASFSQDVLQVEQRQYHLETGRLEGSITKFRQAEGGYEFIGEVPWDTRLFTPVEARRLLQRAGFTAVHCYGGLDGSDLEREASPLVVVAEP